MKSLVIAAVVLTLASAQADAKDINPILQQIIKAHGGCVPSHDIAIKERGRLQKEGIDTKGCVDPKLLSDEELTRVRTYEDEQMRYPPSVMTLSWFEKGIKDFHRNVVLDPLFQVSQRPGHHGVVRIIAVPKEGRGHHRRYSRAGNLWGEAAVLALTRFQESRGPAHDCPNFLWVGPAGRGPSGGHGKRQQQGDA